MHSLSEISVLNSGSYGTVSLVEDARTGRRYASKKLIAKQEWWCKCKCESEAKHEVRVRALLRPHPNIVRLEQVRNELLIYEYCAKGDLQEALPLRVDRIRTAILQMCDAVGYCHQRGVCHRDIKPENVLISAAGTFKLADFGFASIGRWCSDFGTGTAGYMAPEAANGQVKYDAEAADVWSLGIVLVRLLFGRLPWKTEEDRSFQDFKAERETLYDVYDMSRDVFDALGHALRIDPKARSLAKFKQAVSAVRVWTTREELAKMEPVFGLDEDAEWEPLESTPQSDPERSPQSAQSDSESDRDDSGDIFDFEQDLRNPHQVPALGCSSRESLSIPAHAAPKSLPVLSTSWADLDEDFFPHSAGQVV